MQTVCFMRPPAPAHNSPTTSASSLASGGGLVALDVGCPGWTTMKLDFFVVWYMVHAQCANISLSHLSRLTTKMDFDYSK